MPRPFRLFSTPAATRDKGNSEIKSATITTTGKHMMSPLPPESRIQSAGEKPGRDVCITHTAMTSVRTVISLHA